MPPRKHSRHALSFTTATDDGELYLTERTPFRYRPLADSIQHRVKEGDTLWNLAYRYYSPIERPAGLWWVIADFQPTPIFDPTIALAPGRVLWIPSLRTVLEQIFSERRRREIALLT